MTVNITYVTLSTSDRNNVKHIVLTERTEEQ